MRGPSDTLASEKTEHAARPAAPIGPQAPKETFLEASDLQPPSAPSPPAGLRNPLSQTERGVIHFRVTRHSVSGRVRVAIVGGGFSGLGVGLALRRAGIEDFVILEKADELGGTWRDNTYPGCACDVPSHLYSFSRVPKFDWSRVFAEGPEIQRYLLHVADSQDLRRYVRFGAELVGARWDEDAQLWYLETSAGLLEAQVLVAATGPLHAPQIPSFAGLDDFEGVTMHSARWKQDHDLRGRRVAVVGTGSSAIQLVPEIAPLVDELVLMQRTAPWVLPKPDHVYPRAEQALFRHVPGFRRGYRQAIYGTLELLQLAQRRPEVMRRVQNVGLWHLRRQVSDPELREVLTPNFTLGCKRLLLSNTYYPALTRQNATVVRGGLERITATGVVGADGVEREVDTIIFATGFHVTDVPVAHRVANADGRTLAETWRGSPQAYLGTTISGYPNFFFMIGPNLGNGHSSAFVQIEAQAEYVVDAIRSIDAAGVTSVDVLPAVQERYNREVQDALQGTVWNAGGCASYYIDANGRNSTIYPWSTVDMRRRLRHFDRSAYAMRTAPSAEPRIEIDQASA